MKKKIGKQCFNFAFIQEKKLFSLKNHDPENKAVISDVENLLSVKNNWKQKDLLHLTTILLENFDVASIYSFQLEKVILEKVDMCENFIQIRYCALGMQKLIYSKKSNVFLHLGSMLNQIIESCQNYFDILKIPTDLKDLKFNFKSTFTFPGSTDRRVLESRISFIIVLFNFSTQQCEFDTTPWPLKEIVTVLLSVMSTISSQSKICTQLKFINVILCRTLERFWEVENYRLYVERHLKELCENAASVLEMESPLCDSRWHSLSVVRLMAMLWEPCQLQVALFNEVVRLVVHRLETIMTHMQCRIDELPEAVDPDLGRQTCRTEELMESVLMHLAFTNSVLSHYPSLRVSEWLRGSTATALNNIDRLMDCVPDSLTTVTEFENLRRNFRRHIASLDVDTEDHEGLSSVDVGYMPLVAEFSENPQKETGPPETSQDTGHDREIDAGDMESEVNKQSEDMDVVETVEKMDKGTLDIEDRTSEERNEPEQVELKREREKKEYVPELSEKIVEKDFRLHVMQNEEPRKSTGNICTVKVEEAVENDDKNMENFETVDDLLEIFD